MKPGDTVIMKAGGPKMTVEIADEKARTVRCAWFINTPDDSGHSVWRGPYRDEFHVDALEPVVS